jgi:ubiquitin-conjugating enzyme E2 variant
MNETGVPESAQLPEHYTLTRVHLLVSTLSIAAAVGAVAALGFRLATRIDLWQWWVPLVFLGGIAAADLASGFVHWAADTWGRDDLPVVGPLLLVPFRIHHINPDDFLRRRFVDTNGEVALLSVPVLLSLFAVPLDASWHGPVAMFGLAFCGVGMMTNQIHQWAHMPAPPRPVRWLQDLGVLLGRGEHAAHHQRPYDARYCITTGWCNGPLEAARFFRRIETMVRRLTGAQARRDDRIYEDRYVARRPAGHG